MQKIAFTVGFLLVLVGLGVGDVYYSLDSSTFAFLQAEPVQEEIPNQQEPPTEVPTEVAQEEEDAGGIRKQSGPKVETVLGASGLEFQEINEPIFLSKIIPQEEATVIGTVLLKDKDRIGSIAWAESPKIKIYFTALKEALHSSFTPAIQDLVDETQRREGKPPRNLLTFLDTGINEERIVFVRVRDRLFEIHIAEGHKDTLFEIIDKLTE